MRALRDKLWAKLTALVLFVLLGFLALLRTAQLFSNYMPGDEVGGSVLFIAVCAAGCLVCLIFSLSSAGHWAGVKAPSAESCGGSSRRASGWTATGAGT